MHEWCSPCMERSMWHVLLPTATAQLLLSCPVFCTFHMAAAQTSPLHLSSLLLAGCTGYLQAQLDRASTLELSIQEMSWEWHERGAHLQQPAAGAAERLSCHKSGRQTTSQNMQGPSVWKATSSSQRSKHESSSICTQHLSHTACITPTAPCYEGSPQL